MLNSRVSGFDLKENVIVLVCCVEISLEQPVMTALIVSFATFLPPGRSKVLEEACGNALQHKTAKANFCLAAFSFVPCVVWTEE